MLRNRRYSSRTLVSAGHLETKAAIHGPFTQIDNAPFFSGAKLVMKQKTLYKGRNAMVTKPIIYNY